MRLVYLLLTILTGCIMNASTMAQAKQNPYTVEWNSPSADSTGSMPLGNGDIGLNAWVEPNGDLVFLISKTDAWDEWQRLVKLGRVRIHTSPAIDISHFKQTLDVRRGEMTVTMGDAGNRRSYKLWVDANSPVIRLQADGDKAFEMNVNLEVWRTKERILADGERYSAYEPGPGVTVTVYPDTVLPPKANVLSWYHQNRRSIWASTLDVQGMGALKDQFQDPLMNLTYGAAIVADHGIAKSPTVLNCPGSRSHEVLIVPLVKQCDTPELWEQALVAQVQAMTKLDAKSAYAKHIGWWKQLWQRSYIDVSKADVPTTIRDNGLTMRIGLAHDASSRYQGQMAQIRIYKQPLKPDEIARLASGQKLSPSSMQSLAASWPETGSTGLFEAFEGKSPVTEESIYGSAIALKADTGLEISSSGFLEGAKGVTLEAWINPSAQATEGMRVFDKITPGSGEGLLLDVWPSGALRFITPDGIIQSPPCLTAGKWSHVSATLDVASHSARIYCDGKEVARNDRESIPASTAQTITQGWILQRYITVSAGRGAYPIKFNGSIFTFQTTEPGELFDPDYRRWGGPYWFQNTRLAYWPMLASGDYEMMQPLFSLFEKMLPFNKARCRTYWNHDGAFFPETLYIWGAYTNMNFGADRQGKDISWVGEPCIRYHYNGMLELLALMLDYADYTKDKLFVDNQLLPMADELLAFWDHHYTRKNGKLFMNPAQSLETMWDCTNPTPDVAGLQWVLSGLLKLSPELLGTERMSDWTRLLGEVPAVPVAKRNGVKRIMQAEIQGSEGNVENPELYPVWPFRIYGVGKPNLDVALNTLQARKNKDNIGWQQGPVWSAYLGQAEQAGQLVADRFANKYPRGRFPGWYGPNYDWVPDQDHPSVAMSALQSMLVQETDKQILLLPAWPKDWDVSFKLHASQNTTVEVEYRGGVVTKLKVSPESRLGDVKVMVK